MNLDLIKWRKVPWSLWAYVGLTVAGVVLVLLDTRTPVGPLVFFVVFTVVWNFLLLRAIRWVWFVTVIVITVGFTVNIATGSGTWYGHLLGAAELALLLLAPTRQFFAREPKS